MTDIDMPLRIPGVAVRTTSRISTCVIALSEATRLLRDQRPGRGGRGYGPGPGPVGRPGGGGPGGPGLGRPEYCILYQLSASRCINCC